MLQYSPLYFLSRCVAYSSTMEVFVVDKIVELYNHGTPTTVWNHTQSDSQKALFSMGCRQCSSHGYPQYQASSHLSKSNCCLWGSCIHHQSACCVAGSNYQGQEQNEAGFFVTTFQLHIPFSADIQFLACISVGLIEYEVWWLKELCAWRYVG